MDIRSNFKKGLVGRDQTDFKESILFFFLLVGNGTQVEVMLRHGIMWNYTTLPSGDIGIFWGDGAFNIEQSRNVQLSRKKIFWMV